MQPMSVIRKWHTDQLKNTINTLRYLVSTISDSDAHTLRDGADGWTVAEVLGHLADFEQVFIERVTLNLTQDLPDLPFPNPEAMVKERQHNTRSLDVLFAEWETKRRAFLALLEGITDESAWERPAKHPTRGALTVDDQLFLATWHDVNHLDQISKILLAKTDA